MELSSSYDFILFGDHPSGLWAAKHLLSLDKKVLLIPLNDQPVMNAIPRQILKEFEFSQEAFVDRNRDPIQILSTTHRFRLSGNEDRIASEVRFQFGTQDEASIPPELRRGIAHLLGNPDPFETRNLSWSRLVRSALSIAFFDRQSQIWPQKMKRYLSDRGLHIARPDQLKRVFVDRANFVGVQLDGNSKMIPAKAGIVSCHYDAMTKWMSEKSALISAQSGFSFTIRIECDPRAIPRGVTGRMIFVEGGSPILEFFHESPGCFLLKTTLPLQVSSLDYGFQRRLCERMVKVAARLIPDLEYNLKRMVPDLRDVETAERTELPKLYPYSDLNQIPAHQLVFQNHQQPAYGFQSPIGNLYLANDEANPANGVYGAYQSMVQFFDFMSKKKDSPLGVSSMGTLEIP